MFMLMTVHYYYRGTQYIAQDGSDNLRRDRSTWVQIS